MRNLRFALGAKLFLILMILSLIPISALYVPDSQMVLKGFDPNLLDIDPSFDNGNLNASEVIVNFSEAIIIAKQNGGDPSLTTVTTPASFNVSFEATVIRQDGQIHPMHISLWDKTSSNNDAFSIYFDSVSRKIVWEVSNSTNQMDFEVCKYTQNCPYHIQIAFSAGSSLVFSIENSTWAFKRLTLTSDEATILKRPMVSLRFFAAQYDQGGESMATLQSYQVEFPSQAYFVFFTNFLGASLNLVYLLFFAIIIILWRNDFLRLLNQIAVFFRRVINEVKRGNNETKLIATLFFSSIFVQFLFSFLGSQPYDSYAQKTWAYISTKYGTDHLYTLSNIVPSGRSVGTFSTINFAYPYPPLLSYIYWFSGLLYSVASPAFDMHTFVLGILMKMPWILATSMLGILIYYFSRKNFSAKVAFILSSLCLFNPCIIFESVIWGQSDSLIASLLILSVFALRKNSIRSMWFFIGLALLTKQTAIIPALFISFFALRKFGLSKSIQNLAFPFTCLFLFLSPFFLMGYSPSFIFNVSVGQNVLNVIGTPQRAAEWQIVASGGAHNLWPILTGALGESGWERFAYPYQHSPLSSVADLTIFVVLIFFILIMMQSILSEKQEINNEKPTFYLLFLAVLTLYTFFTRMQTRYLYLTIPFLIFSFRWIHNRKAFSLLFATLTALFFLSDYSYFTLTGLWQPAFFPNFSPAANPLNLLIFGFVTNDTLITALCSAIFSFFILSMLFSSLRIFNARARNKREKTQSMTLAGDIYRPKYLPKKLWKMAISIHNRLFVDYIQFALKSEVKRNSSVLELGCGKESPIVSLANHLNLSSAVDLYKPSLMYNKKHQYYRHYLLADIRVLPFTPNSFDCIVALDVLEHLCKAEGQRLLVEMEKLSRRKIVILTPNGFSPKLHCEDENVLQHHHSAWISADFTKLGFMVYGINGHKALRGEQAHAVIRPRLIGHLVSKLTERFVYGHPSLAFQLLCIKDKVRMNEPKVHYSSSHNTYGGALPCC